MTGHYLESIEGKLKALESALTMDAEKAFSIPLLRKDLETIRQVTNQRLEDLRASIERGAESNRWMIGIAITLALGLVGIVVNLYMQRKGQESGTLGLCRICASGPQKMTDYG